MTDNRQLAVAGFHSGELDVQRRAGALAEAARLASMVSRGELRAGIGAFLTTATVAAITARDRAGRLWVSPLLGRPGFLQVASPTRLLINSTPPATDPLHTLPVGQPIGLIIIDFITRRRVRINGILAAVGVDALSVDVEQAYGNCPQYIQQRRLRIGSPHTHDTRPEVFRADALRPEDIRLIQAADTFFLGTTHPDSGNDASHRGGPAGFVRVMSDRLWWPDYPGNNMFNSFGNLAVDPTAALLFADFHRGATLQLSGTAMVRWGDPATAGDDAHTGRRVEFTSQEVIAATVPIVGETDHMPYARNPALTDA
jgi:predicted pyridoxine 5'-phosphate oxidase superfamily flavin-nucleotide-binding protein